MLPPKGHIKMRLNRTIVATFTGLLLLLLLFMTLTFRFLDKIMTAAGGSDHALAVLTQNKPAFQAEMHNSLVYIAVSGLLILLLAALFSYLVYRERRQQADNLVHLENEHLLEIQEGINTQLQLANATLEESGATSQRLLGELEISRIEIEEQNTELQRSQQELETQQIELEL